MKVGGDPRRLKATRPVRACLPVHINVFLMRDGLASARHLKNPSVKTRGASDGMGPCPRHCKGVNKLDVPPLSLNLHFLGLMTWDSVVCFFAVLLGLRRSMEACCRHE